MLSNNQKIYQGFTLIEVIIYIGILGLTMTAMVFFALAVGNERDKAYSASEVSANTFEVLDQIKTLVHEARSINDSASIWDNDQGQLALFLGDNQTSPVTISLVNGQVSLQYGTTLPVLISTRAVSVSRLKFSKLSDHQVALDLLINYGALGVQLTPEKVFQQNLTTTINLRL